jgi:glucose 1-dehydrogenase
MEKLSLKGKAAIVTGAGLGMGRATAVLFAERGAKVLVADWNEAAGKETAAAIRKNGGAAEFVRTNVADEASVAAMVAACVAAFGRLDCAVNNAGVSPETAPIHALDLAEADRILGVNLRGVLASMKHELKQIVSQGGGGAIVNTGSVNSQRPQPNSTVYTAAKHAVAGMTKAAAIDYAQYGVRVNAVLPGAIRTPMLESSMAEHNLTEKDFAPVLSLFGRFGAPEEVAEASAWLCSDAASYVTGHCLAVDAGYLAR